jgi:hypothetical protein
VAFPRQRLFSSLPATCMSLKHPRCLSHSVTAFCWAAYHCHNESDMNASPFVSLSGASV